MWTNVLLSPCNSDHRQIHFECTFVRSYPLPDVPCAPSVYACICYAVMNDLCQLRINAHQKRCIFAADFCEHLDSYIPRCHLSTAWLICKESVTAFWVSAADKGRGLWVFLTLLICVRWFTCPLYFCICYCMLSFHFAHLNRYIKTFDPKKKPNIGTLAGGLLKIKVLTIVSNLMASCSAICATLSLFTYADLSLTSNSLSSRLESIAKI